MKVDRDKEAVSWGELNISWTDFLRTMRALAIFSAAVSLLMIVLGNANIPISKENKIDQTDPYYYSQTSFIWGEMKYSQIVPVSSFLYNGNGMELASLNVSFPLYIMITPRFHYIDYEIGALSYSTSLTTSALFGMSDNYGTIYEGKIYYTKTGVATRSIDWDPSFSVSEIFGFSTMTTNVFIHERVFAESGKNAVEGMALVNNNIVIHWGAIAFTIVSFGITS